MKLIFCTNCYDVFNLRYEMKTCSCKKSAGRYRSELDAEIEGEHALPLGFENKSFMVAIKNQPSEGMGKRFEAFVIPKKVLTIKRKRIK